MPMNAPRFAVRVGDRVSFAFVRNPWARMVSLYRHLCQRLPMPYETYNPEAMREMGFKAWLNEPLWLGPDRIYQKLPPMQKRPQMWWAEGCSFIGRVENLEQDFAEACRLAKIRSPNRLPRLNKTHGGDWRAEYDIATVDFVGYYFAKDIQKFGYQFDEKN